MPLKNKKFYYNKIEYYFLGLLILAIVGFWPSYFSKLIDKTNSFSFYFHFHATVVTLWILMLIGQPILIRLKKNRLHKQLGKSSFLVVPLIYLSVIFLKHHLIQGDEKFLGIAVWVPLKDLILFSFGYGVALLNRNKIELHARGMIVSGIVFIEPALVRFMATLLATTNYSAYSYYITIGLLYSLLCGILFFERNQKNGRWIFPATLGFYVFAHSIILFKINTPLQPLAEWFANLPLT